MPPTRQSRSGQRSKPSLIKSKTLQGKLKINVQYRADDQSPFKTAYLKGVGNTAAWTKKFVETFNLVPIEKREEAASSASDAADTEGGIV